MNRNDIIGSLKGKPDVQVLIVGGGINGIGTFRDLALNGVDVLLVERGDFCSGASAASSHMAHGGIRYLENGEFRLVHEAVQERNRLIENAPHLVKPLPTTIPIFKLWSGLLNAPLKFLRLLDRPSERGAFIIKVGLMLYDAYTGRQRTVPRHSFEGRGRSLAQWPRLNPHIKYTATYYDGAILQPERLGLELVLDAEAEGRGGARALNYVSMVGATGRRVQLRDELTGETFEVRPQLLINAAGPWIDLADRSMGLSTRFIGGTKGSHLVLDHPELRAAIGDHEFFFENKDGRIVLIFPLYDRVLVGTSDIPIENPDEARCTPEEVQYFIGLVDRVFPSIKVGEQNIVYRFSGVRPLAASNAKTTGQITRDHEIEVVSGEWTGLSFPVYALVGGKWTSFRAFSEQVTDKALEALGMQRTRSTRDLPVGGGKGYPAGAEERRRRLEGAAAWAGVSAARAAELFERYGTRGELVAEFIGRGHDEPLKNVPGYSRREVGFIGQCEKVVHLEDVLLRRTMLAMLGHLSRQGLDEVASALGEALGWTRQEREAELRRALDVLHDRHGVEL